MEAAYEDRIRQLTDVARRRQRDWQSFAWQCLSVRGAQPQPADVQDALSEAYLTAATRLRNEPTLIVENLEAWFRKVLFFVCLKQADARHKLGLVGTLESLQGEDEVLQFSPSWDHNILARQLLDNLEPEEREIVTMAGQGLTSKEIGQALGKSGENVRQIKARAIAKLKAGLKRGSI
jgi:RNA polymerase sigma factor (sigma-70 family)